MNKRKIIVLIVLILAVLSIMGIIIMNKPKTIELKAKNNHIAIMVQNDSGDGYHLWDKEIWPSSGYAFERGTCNNGENIEWDADHELVTLNSIKADKCTLYFQLAPKSLGDAIKELIENGNEVQSGEGYLYFHNSSLTNGAEDGGYRYAGNQPNNYICFGSGSEEYNSGTDTECPLTNKYRIIGLVPVTKSDNTSEMLVKIIKAEYITADELGISSTGTVSSNSSYIGLKRIEAVATSLNGFHWNNTANNTWAGSSLYNALNNETTGYLSFLYGTDETKKQNWESKVETVKWNVGGWNTNRVTPQAAYTAEMTNSGSTGAGTTVEAKVGLMYVHDYGFASIKDSWTSTLNNYGNTGNKNRENNWLFNGVYEWTISRASSSIYSAFYVGFTGSVTSCDVRSDSFVVRPVLYLTSDVKLGGGEGIDGSQSKPYKVS